MPSFDIVFLDIYMLREDGVDIARILNKISPETRIVFVTTSEEHAVSAFSLDALHYLVKPVTTEGNRRIVPAINRVPRKAERNALTFCGRGYVHCFPEPDMLFREQ